MYPPHLPHFCHASVPHPILSHLKSSENFSPNVKASKKTKTVEETYQKKVRHTITQHYDIKLRVIDMWDHVNT